MVDAVKYPLTKIPIKDLLENGQLADAVMQRDLQLLEIAELNRHYVPREGGRLQIISDGMAQIINPADGKPYDSKSKYYQTLKDKGCHVIEAGHTSKRQEADHNVRPDLMRALNQIPLKGK